MMAPTGPTREPYYPLPFWWWYATWYMPLPLPPPHWPEPLLWFNPKTGILFVNDDGKWRPIGGGDGGPFLPLSGGTITGNLQVDGDLGVTGAVDFGP